ncbi:replication initiation protein [Azohydromonas aeria]|uniref:replication initiation protein n=1 Tax=Azohydromonas aeria TaxID=2590212 RepID=UPI0012FB3E22|nr:replication initiation protein [Azohydromonas aeria]
MLHSSHALRGQGGACSHEAAAASWRAALLADGARRFPRRPYCSDDPKRYGQRVRDLEYALTKPHIQVNLPTAQMALVFDIDRRGGAHAWEDADLPHPTWAAINPENGHAHIAWGLKVPVRMKCADASMKALRYAAAIEGRMSERLGADPSYRGVTTKNPLHPQWIVDHPGRLLLYELDDLAEWLPELPTYRPPRRTQEQAGLGRNVDLFDTLRKWACRAIRDYWSSGPRGWDAWLEQCESRAGTINAGFLSSLHWPEVRHIAKSVARWTWKHITAEGFSAWQAVQGKKAGIASGKARRAASEDKRASARLMALAGRSSREIGAELGVDQSTVVRWLKG